MPVVVQEPNFSSKRGNGLPLSGQKSHVWICKKGSHKYGTPPCAVCHKADIYGSNHDNVKVKVHFTQ